MSFLKKQLQHDKMLRYAQGGEKKVFWMASRLALRPTILVCDRQLGTNCDKIKRNRLWKQPS